MESGDWRVEIGDWRVEIGEWRLESEEVIRMSNVECRTRNDEVGIGDWRVEIDDMPCHIPAPRTAVSLYCSTNALSIVIPMFCFLL